MPSLLVPRAVGRPVGARALVAASACVAYALGGGAVAAAQGAAAQGAAAQAPHAEAAGARDSVAVAVQLDSARAALVRALNSRDKTTMLALFADSATATPPGATAPMAAGAFLDTWMQQGSALSSLQLVTLKITGPADATESGEWTLATSDRGSYTLVWHRTPSGRWAIRSLNST